MIGVAIGLGTTKILDSIRKSLGFFTYISCSRIAIQTKMVKNPFYSFIAKATETE